MAKLVNVKIDNVTLEGTLDIPKGANGLVLFAHGSGSSRLSPRNTFVAKVLNKSKIATLLFDLLTEEEDQIYENRFNIDLLNKRLVAVTNWVKKQPGTKGLKIGYFGASTGAASALIASAQLKNEITAVVSRGGRPDLAMAMLENVVSPTLLIVGGRDFEVIELNQQAYDALTCTKKLEIVEGATHLFEEEGTLKKVADLACDWFLKYFKKGARK
ncbi:MAG: dienelactone hydrolase family protein [Candidatus Curtissbacteria bacterium]|nr:dienelactone hydrolase family protein [Candidatus Curtissbacteria bacterium]